METLDIYGIVDGRERVIIHNVRDSQISDYFKIQIHTQIGICMFFILWTDRS